MKNLNTKNYEEFCGEMILRDYLALDRTILANTRTMLAYARTSIGLLASGTGMVKLVTGGFIHITGYVFIAAAFPILIIGIVEYSKMKSTLAALQKKKSST